MLGFSSVSNSRIVDKRSYGAAASPSWALATSSATDHAGLQLREHFQNRRQAMLWGCSLSVLGFSYSVSDSSLRFVMSSGFAASSELALAPWLICQDFILLLSVWGCSLSVMGYSSLICDSGLCFFYSLGLQPVGHGL